MPWLKIDDTFEEHAKVKPLSDAAHRLWMRAACWCRKTGSDGFVPRKVLSSVAQNSTSISRLEKLAAELVSATAGGVFASGLWEEVDGGWRFHDWQEYQPEVEQKQKLTRSEAAAIAGRASAKARETLHGTSQPTKPERSRDVRETFGEQRSGDVHRTNVEPPEPPDPDPRSDLKPTTKDLKTSPREESPSVAAAASQSQKVRCPADLRLTDDQRGALETCLIPGWAIDELTNQYVSAELADETKAMPLVAWRKCLAKSISSCWNDQRRRPKRPESTGPTIATAPPTGGEPGQAWHPGGYWYYPLPEQQAAV